MACLQVYLACDCRRHEAGISSIFLSKHLAHFVQSSSSSKRFAFSRFEISQHLDAVYPWPCGIFGSATFTGVALSLAELQELKQRVVQCIKENNELEQALNTMDIKIGLLVKNRITLQVRKKALFRLFSKCVPLSWSVAFPRVKLNSRSGFSIFRLRLFKLEAFVKFKECVNTTRTQRQKFQLVVYLVEHCSCLI